MGRLIAAEEKTNPGTSGSYAARTQYQLDKSGNVNGRKKYNKMRYAAKPGPYDKHTKAKTIEEARLISSKTTSSPAQYLPYVNNKILEHQALMKGIPVRHSDSTIYFIYKVEKVIWYDRGMPATYIRAELANNKIYHGHPIAEDRVKKYIDITKCF